MAEKLTIEARKAALHRLSNWTYDDHSDAIRREITFGDFSEAFAFMTRVALLAEKAGHHPDWSNAYDKVAISLSTHDAGGLSGKDVDLAEKIDALLA